jgi:hypothetical protein
MYIVYTPKEENKVSKDKKLKTFRLSERTVRDLEQLATRWSVTQTDVLTVLIQEANNMGSVLDENEGIQDKFEMIRRVRGL